MAFSGAQTARARTRSHEGRCSHRLRRGLQVAQVVGEAAQQAALAQPLEIVKADALFLCGPGWGVGMCRDRNARASTRSAGLRPCASATSPPTWLLTRMIWSMAWENLHAAPRLHWFFVKSKQIWRLGSLGAGATGAAASAPASPPTPTSCWCSCCSAASRCSRSVPSTPVRVCGGGGGGVQAGRVGGGGPAPRSHSRNGRTVWPLHLAAPPADRQTCSRAAAAALTLPAGARTGGGGGVVRGVEAHVSVSACRRRRQRGWPRRRLPAASQRPTHTLPLVAGCGGGRGSARRLHRPPFSTYPPNGQTVDGGPPPVTRYRLPHPQPCRACKRQAIRPALARAAAIGGWGPCPPALRPPAAPWGKPAGLSHPRARCWVRWAAGCGARSRWRPPSRQGRGCCGSACAHSPRCRCRCRCCCCWWSPPMPQV